MIRRSSAIRNFILNFPGYKTFGLWIFMPFFFAGGAALEYAMVNWNPNGHNFYATYKRNQSQLEALRRLEKLLEETEDKPPA